MKLVITKAPKNISVLSKMGCMVRFGDLDVIDFGDLPPYVHLLVEQLINKESVGYTLTSHVLQEIEDRAYQMTV